MAKLAGQGGQLFRCLAAFFILLCAQLSSTALGAANGQTSDSRTDGINIIDNNNQLPLLDNRFRIDHEVKEITLLFFRRSGSPPVILVRPDGSKMYATMAVTGEADWFDETTYDLIRIKKPMPGPWQAIGQLTKGSKVLIITDFELNVDDLPEILIQGETIKLTGYVTNNGEPIKARNFRDVITLEVDFVSTNNKKHTNFGAGVVQVTRFVDNGVGFDERPKDGIFTGEFVLSFAPGEWIPKYHIHTPLMTRELEHDPIIVQPNPVSVSVETTDIPDKFHRLIINIEGDYVKKESMIFQGKIYYPNQEVQSFSVTENISEARIFNVINYDFGIYRVSMSAFGENANGREFMLEIPDFSFIIDPPLLEDTDLSEGIKFDVDGNPIISAEDAAAAALAQAEKVPEPVDHTNTIIITVLGNLLLALVGWLMLRTFVQKKPIKINFKLPKISLKRKGKKGGDEKADEEGKRDKNQSEDDDILDLSLPDN